MKTSGTLGGRGRRGGWPTAMAMFAMAAAGAAHAQVTDTKIPLNYNYHGYGHGSEAVASAPNSNADSILYRSISDRGLYWNTSDLHGFGTLPILGATGIGYSLFDTLGYANTTNPQASSYGFDSVHLSNRVYYRGFETSSNTNTNIGNAPAWAPIFDVATLTGNGATATATTVLPHNFAVGQVINIVGASPAAFDGNVTVTAVPDANTFQYACTGTGTATGSMFMNSTSQPIISSLSIAGTVATGTSVWPHGLAVNNIINITGSSDIGYQGQWTVATVPTTSTFTFTNLNSPTNNPSGNQIIASTCMHDVDQVTTLASPVTLDANSEIGVLYTASDGSSAIGGSFDVVLTFSDATTVTARLQANDWTNTTAPNIISNLVSSQQLIKHTVSGTTSLAFRGLQNVDTCSLNTFGTSNINVVEGIISVPNMTAAGINVVGKSLTKITFRNAFSNPVQMTALTLNGSQATATIGTTNNPYVVGQPIVISGVNGTTPSVNGPAKITSISNGTTFTFDTTATGTPTAKMFCNGLPVTSITLVAATGTVVLDAPGQTFAIGDRVTISGANSATAPNTYVNGTFTVASVTDATHFTYKNNGSTGTVSAQMQVTRPGQNRGYQIHAVSVRKGTPTNATCASAQAFGPAGPLGVSLSGTNSHTNETTAPTHSCGTSDNTAVYYTYTAQGNNPITITGCAPFAHSISVYTGSCGALTQVSGACATSGTSLGCGGTNSPNVSAATTFTGTANTTYYIRLAGNSGATGAFTVTVQEFTNAVCSGAVPIAAGDTAGTTILNASGGTTPCGGGSDTNAMWFQYTVTGPGTHLVEARTCLNPSGVGNSAGSPTALPLDTTLAVYSTCGGTPVACNDDGCSVSSRLQWMAANGSTYLIRVASKGTTVGNFTLHIDDPVHTDITMPIQFNWNGICHGTYVDPNTSAVTSEQTVPISGSIGATNENRFNQNGYRSIADRSLLFDPNNSVKDALNYGATIGYQGIQYQLYTTPFQSDMVHLGNRTLAGGGRPWAVAGTTWPAEGGTSTNINGLRPLWLNNDDQTPDQTSSMSSLSAVFGPNTKIGIIYHASNVTVGLTAKFDVTLRFTDSSQVVVTLNATDWFYNNTGVLADSPMTNGAGMERQQVLGIYHGTYNTDMAIDAASPNTIGPLKVDEAIISTASLQAMTAPFDPTGKTLSSITFGNVRSGNAAADNFSSAIGIFAATLRDPASYNLNFGPSAVGTVTPNQLNAGGTGKMTVSVSRGSGSPNNITSVVVDASSIGLSSTFALNDSGTGGDTAPNDNVWSRNISFPINTPPNPGFILPFTATDAQSRTATGNIIFSIVTPTGTFTPSTGVLAGFTSVHTAFVFGSAGGISSVVLDASQLGLSSTLALNDSGTAGDTAANDGTWGVNFVPAASVAAATYSIPYTITDTSSNAVSGTLSITIAPPSGACCTNTSGACAVVVATSCTGTTSVYNGDNSTCQTGTPSPSCPLTGICCTNSTGACGLLYGGSCATTAVQGLGTTCATGTPSTSCPVISSCCNGTTGACTFIYGGSCPSGTTSSGFTTCDANTCPASGTCCNNSTGACTLVYGGNACGTGTTGSSGTVCGANTCPITAVCCDVSGVCIAIYGGLCPANSTLASGTTCNGNVTCPATGSCCNGATGACTLNYTGSCASPLTFSTSTSCSPSPCTSQPHTCENFDGSGSLPANWTTQSTGAGAVFAIVSDQSHSPSNAAFTNDVATASTQSLVLPAVTAAGTLTLDFWSYYACEGTTTFFDGWVVEYSTDGGANWTDVGTAGWALNGYNAATISTCCTNAIGGRPAFGGSALTWTEHIAAIPASAGQQVMIRFLMSSDSSIASTGLWLDDICVANIQVVSPGVCCRGATCSTAYANAADCAAATTTASSSGPGWKFVTTASPCNAGVNPDGTYTTGFSGTQTPCCLANYNHNAGLEIQDIFDFLNDWFAGRAIAIPGGDGTSTTGLAVQNIFNFLNAWFAGGCS